jgi:hypothetical protein
MSTPQIPEGGVAVGRVGGKTEQDLVEVVKHVSFGSSE